MKRFLHLEDFSLVAYWDQRGCGKSFDKSIKPETINFSQMKDDIISVTGYLLNKYKRDKAVLIGYSIGATASLMAAVKNPGIFCQIFLVGIDIDISKANKFALDFAMNKSLETNNKKFIDQIVELGKSPIVDSKKFQKRAKIITDLGGIRTGSSYNDMLISTVKDIVFNRFYGFKGLSKTIQGMEFCQNALLPELETLNLFNIIKKVNVPVNFIQGRKDGIAPFEIAFQYFNFLEAGEKTFTAFENSAHMPHYEEPEKFANLLKDKIRRG